MQEWQCMPVKEPEQGASGDKLGDDAEVGGLGASPHEQHHVGMLQPFHDAHLSSELLQHHSTPSRSSQLLCAHNCC